MNTPARSGILAGGNWIVDKLKIVDTYPREDALANILAQSHGNGGSPFNILVDLAKLQAGAPSPFPLAGIGLVGRDADGAWIRGQCAALGIDTTALLDADAPTSYTDVMTVQSTGRRTFFHQRGANALLDAGHFVFEPASPAPATHATTQPGANARIFHLGYLLLLDRLDQPDPEFGTVAARVLARAQAAGLRTSVDLVSEESDRFKTLVFPALRHTDYLLLNELELERTTGIAVRKGSGESGANSGSGQAAKSSGSKSGIDFPALQAAAAQLLAAGVREWVIVHFPEGACALGWNDGEAGHSMQNRSGAAGKPSPGPLHFQPSQNVPQGEIASAVGAGDAFAAGALYGLHEGEPIAAVLRYGVSAAAACLRGTGASDSLRPLAECLALGERHGWREGVGF